MVDNFLERGIEPWICLCYGNSLYTQYCDIKLVDIMDGSIYEIPEKMIEDKGDGVFVIKGLPINDTPLILTFGRFIELE